jgi:putative tryptophan/tyrosine transport system substrate-binding protein
VQDAAHAAARQLHVLHASDEHELETAFAAIGRLKPGALLVASDPWLHTRRAQTIALATRYAVPTMYQWRESTDEGGLMSYGTNLADAYREVGVYTGRVLKGASPADLPVVQPTKFELVINLKTAKSLGLQIPSGVLAIADAVIE